jgi:hypothetical protein
MDSSNATVPNPADTRPNTTHLVLWRYTGEETYRKRYATQGPQIRLERRADTQERGGGQVPTTGEAGDTPALTRARHGHYSQLLRGTASSLSTCSPCIAGLERANI